MSGASPAASAAAPLLLCLDALTMAGDSDLEPSGPHGHWSGEARRLLAHARAAGWWVGHAISRRPAAAARWVALAGFSPLPSEPVFHRDQASALSCPALQEAMARRPQLEAILCGVSVDGSCLATALEAARLGVRLTIAMDATWMSGAEQAGLQGLRELQARNLLAPGRLRLAPAQALLRSIPQLRVVQGGRR